MLVCVVLTSGGGGKVVEEVKLSLRSTSPPEADDVSLVFATFVGVNGVGSQA